MAEYFYIEPQTVAAGGNVIYNGVSEKGCNYIRHRDGSGIVSLRGGHRYRAAFSANITGATADVPVSLAIAVNGEPIAYATMIVTPSAANELINVSAETIVSVPLCCCYSLSVVNPGAAAITVQNANIIIIKEDLTA